MHRQLLHSVSTQQGAVVGSVALHVLLAVWFISAPMSVQMLPQQMIEVTLVPAAMVDVVVRQSTNTHTPPKQEAKPKPIVRNEVAPKTNEASLVPMPKKLKEETNIEKTATPQELAEISPSAAPVATAPQSAAITKPLFDAAYLRNPAPDYPSQAKRRGMEGVVMLDVLVHPDGVAAAVSVAQSSGYTMLDESARDAVQRWKFVPAKRGAQTVEARVMVPIEFKLQ